MAKRLDYEDLSLKNHNILQFELIAFQENFNDIKKEMVIKTHAQIEIDVMNIDDSFPQIKFYGSNSIEIPENSPAGMVVFEFVAIDLDSKKLSYDLQGFEVENFVLKQVLHFINRSYF